jgi:hypothetical protein
MTGSAQLSSGMTTSPLSHEDIRAAAETYRELDTGYGDAVVASFLDKIDKEIAARVDAHLATGRPVARAQRTRPAQPARPAGPGTLAKGIAIGIASGGVPLLATLFVQFRDGSELTATGWLVTIWLVMTIAATASAARNRWRRRQ